MTYVQIWKRAKGIFFWIFCNTLPFDTLGIICIGGIILVYYILFK